MIFRAIGRAIRGVVGGIGRSLGGGGLLKGVFNFAKKKIGGLLKGGPLGGLLKGVLNKLPFGKALGGIVNKFFKNPLAMLAQGPMGMLNNLMPNLFKGMGGGIPGLLQNLAGGLGAGGIQQNVSPQGQNNLLQMLAFNHANSLFGMLTGGGFNPNAGR